MFRKRQAAAIGLVVYMTAAASVARAQSNVPEIYFVDDVAAQFNQLALRPEPFGFGSPDDFSPTLLDHHYQGVVRKHGPGTPYLFVSRNSTAPSISSPAEKSARLSPK